MSLSNAIYIGFDQREIAAYLVAVHSIRRHLSRSIPIYGVELRSLTRQGLYQRTHIRKDGNLYDVISEHQMSTEFANSRFLVPYLSDMYDWALFADCDILARGDLVELFKLADYRYAVMCVKHNHVPKETTKMDGQVQSRYPKKNWSSVCLWNNRHPSNKKLTLRDINSRPGRELHDFFWLREDEIGELPLQYNWLVNSSPKLSTEPQIVHFTSGIPHIKGYEDCDYSSEWLQELSTIIPGILDMLGTLPESLRQVMMRELAEARLTNK